VNLDSKFAFIFHTYGEELAHVQDSYERHRHNPPVARNMPPVAGNILWARHLMQRIEEPMRTFQANPALATIRDSRKVIKTYNKVETRLWSCLFPFRKD
jgi:dynein heavy chain, axonemal